MAEAPPARAAVARQLTGDLPKVKLTWRHFALGAASALMYAFAQPFVWPGDLDGVHAALNRQVW